MASYTDLYGLINNGDLRLKILSAVVIAANTIRTEEDTVTNHANRVVWAKQAVDNPESKVTEVITLVLAQNKDASVSGILGAPDDAIQTNVNSVIDFLADGT